MNVKITKEKIDEWKKSGILSKAFKVLEEPLSKEFEKQYFSKQAQQIDELAMSGDIIKIAEALKNTWLMYGKNPKERAWELIFFKNITHFRYLVSLIENINQDDAYIKVLSVLTGKEEKVLKKERSNLRYE